MTGGARGLAGVSAKPFIVPGACAFDEAATFLRQSQCALHSQRAKKR
jgi:hypothetical protein